MNKTMRLVNQIKAIAAAYKSDINNLSYTGPRGGSNAANIQGWTHNGNGTITKACRLAGVPIAPYWSGSAKTPASAIPQAINDQAVAAYNTIFA
jgi:hypothetical protein